ncbi:MAG: signal peptidase II [Planctomycetota bacterium]
MSPTLRPGFGRRVLSALLIVGCIGCDQATKRLAVDHLAGAPPREYLGGTVRIVYAENRGAFLGLGGDWSERARITVFVVLTGAILAWATWALLRRRDASALERLGLLLLVGGGAGNLIDRVRLGYVVDFMNLGLGPVRTGIFNVADVVLMIGLAALVLAPRTRSPLDATLSAAQAPRGTVEPPPRHRSPRQ